MGHGGYPAGEQAVARQLELPIGLQRKPGVTDGRGEGQRAEWRFDSWLIGGTQAGARDGGEQHRLSVLWWDLSSSAVAEKADVPRAMRLRGDECRGPLVDDVLGVGIRAVCGAQSDMVAGLQVGDALKADLLPRASLTT